jgi:hypothetical protein
VTLAVPCRTDEPALARMLAEANASWRAAHRRDALEVMVCLNGGDAARAPALAQLDAFARARETAVAVVAADDPRAALPPVRAPLDVVALVTPRAGKALAWNLLRQRARGALALFADADVSIAPPTFGMLLDALAASPHVVLASAKTVCAPRPSAFERIMAAPYGVDFPNLSAQLYAARPALLPAAMPEDLIEPERWLELIVGRDRLVREPRAHVEVRLPADLADFLRQRVRIEMGKIQIARDYPGLAARGAPQPRSQAALASLGATELACLAAYLALRLPAHLVAQWRWRRGLTAGVWKQVASTKRWDGR